MEIDLAVLADAATIDASGKLNILGIFDRIGAHSFPVRHPHLSLVLRICAGLNETGRHDVGIRLRAPGGEDLLELNGEMHVGPGPAHSAGMVRIPHVLNLDGIVFPGPGAYTFEVAVDGEHHVSLPLTVYGPEAGHQA